MSAILGNSVALEMETATKSDLVLNFYKRCSKYIWDLYPNQMKKDVYDIMKRIYEEN
jgi:hypothetical protein